jgi:hypothetical protein
MDTSTKIAIGIFIFVLFLVIIGIVVWIVLSKSSTTTTTSNKNKKVFTIANVTSSGTNGNPPSSQYFSIPSGVTSYTLDFDSTSPDGGGVNVLFTGDKNNTSGYSVSIPFTLNSQASINAANNDGTSTTWDSGTTSTTSKSTIHCTIAIAVAQPSICMIAVAASPPGKPLNNNMITCNPFADGYIGFSDNGSQVSYKNIKVTY